MPIQIHHTVIHGFSKAQHDVDVTEVVKKNVLLNARLPAVESLVDGVAKLLGKRSNAQVWGRFNEVAREGLFARHFSEFAQHTGPTEFLSLTHVAVDELVRAAKRERLATGGHILFSLYADDAGITRLVVAMIKQKGGIQLDANYVPVGITAIDMGKLYQAAHIHLPDYLAFNELAGEEIPHSEKNYLSFLSSRDAGEASAYFISALGCELRVSPTRSTERVFEATNEFFASQPDLSIYRKDASEQLAKYLQDQLSSGSPADLEGICHVLQAIVPPQHAVLTAGLMEFFNSDKYQIPAEFHVHKGILTKHVKVSLESESMKLKFTRSIIGTDQNAQVYYNQQNKSLLIKDLPASFVAKLDQALAQP